MPASKSTPRSPAKLKTPSYPYQLSDAQDRTAVSRIDKESDPLLDSIKHLVDKQNRLITYERLERERAIRQMREQNDSLREQLRQVGGGEEEDGEGGGSDDIKMLSTSSLVNLDRSSSSLNREGLQYLVRQLTDIVEVRTIDLSSNHLADDCAQELAELVMLDRKGAENPKEQVGFDGLDLSFNDLGPKAAEKVMKFGVTSKWLSFVNLEGNIDLAVENNMGSFMAENIKAGAGLGGTGRKRAGKTAKSSKASKAPPTSVRSMQQRKLTSFRCTLFDYKLTITDQNAVIGANPKKKGARKAPAARGSKKGKSAVASGNPMNALSFVRSLFNAPAVASASKKKGASRPAPRGGKGKKKGGGKSSSNAVLEELFQYITQEKADVFKGAFLPTLLGRALDAQIPTHEMKDTLLCHAIRHNKFDHIKVLLELKASPTAPNGAGSSPIKMAKFLGLDHIENLLREAAAKHDPNNQDILEPIPTTPPPPPPPIQHLGLVHAKLSKDTITVLSQNLNGLLSLDITGAFVGAYGAQIFSRALSVKPSTLKTLNLSQNSIGCAGAECVSEMLSFNDTLTSLNLSSNDVGDGGARFVTQAMKINKTLKVISVGDNPISRKEVNRMLGAARKCENLESVRGTDMLLAPVKLRSMVEHNSEGRKGAAEGEGGEDADDDNDEDDEDMSEACQTITRENGCLVSAQNGGGEWDCLKVEGIPFNQDTELEFNFRLTKEGSGVPKPVKSYTLLVCRKRFGLPWVAVAKIECKKGSDQHSNELHSFKKSSLGFASLAGDSLALWCRVEPVGKGNNSHVVRGWNVKNCKGKSFKEGGGGTVAWM